LDPVTRPSNPVALRVARRDPVRNYLKPNSKGEVHRKTRTVSYAAVQLRLALCKYNLEE